MSERNLKVLFLLVALMLSGQLGFSSHKVGVNLTHLYTPTPPGSLTYLQDCGNRAIIRNYGNSSFRNEVLSVLNAYYRDGGVRNIRVLIWFSSVGIWGNLSYPPTAQELSNLTSYMTDIKNTPSRVGGSEPLTVSISFAAFGAADWNVSPQDCVEDSTFVAAGGWNTVRNTYTSLIDAIRVSGVTVQAVELENEMKIYAHTDQDCQPGSVICSDPKRVGECHDRKIVDQVWPHLLSRLAQTPPINSAMSLDNGNKTDTAIFHSGWFRASNPIPRIVSAVQTAVDFFRSRSYSLPDVFDFHIYPCNTLALCGCPDPPPAGGGALYPHRSFTL
jgi:hypothetical protein